MSEKQRDGERSDSGQTTDEPVQDSNDDFVAHRDVERDGEGDRSRDGEGDRSRDGEAGRNSDF